MAQVNLPVPLSQHIVLITRHSPKVTELTLGKSAVVFYEDTPIIVSTGGVVYFNGDKSGHRTRVINEWSPDYPHTRLAASEFDFVVGQVLSQTAAHLIRKPEVPNNA